MVITMLNDVSFIVKFILIDRNNRAYSYDTRRYLGEIHELRRSSNVEEHVTINRVTIRYLYNEIFLPHVNRSQPTNLNEHPFRPYTDERNQNEIRKYKDIKKTLIKYQKFIKNNFENVGENFAYEARSLHYNKNKYKDKQKGIYGKASLQDVKELKEEVDELKTLIVSDTFCEKII